MMLEEGEILTLKNKDYIVLNIIDYNLKKYAYLISDFKPLEVMVVEIQIIEDNLVFAEVSDQNLLEEILKIVSEEE